MNVNLDRIEELLKDTKDMTAEELGTFMYLLTKDTNELSYTGPRQNHAPYGAVSPWITVCKIGEFDAAHNNPFIDGKCKYLHGHTYKYEVYVRTIISDKTGISIDFRELKKFMKEMIEEKLDHKYLNEVLPFIPSTENIVIWIFQQLSPHFPVDKVRLWENPTSFAEITADDLR
ncbi:6-carboxy-5,6,7,8-tetrahydropterin synthase [compost metagenome]